MASPISRTVSRFQRATVALLKVRQKDTLAERYEPLLREFFRHYEHLLMFRLNEVQKVKELSPEAVNDVLSSVEFDTTPVLQSLILHIEKDALMQGAKQVQDQFRPRMMAAVREPEPVATFTLDNKRAVQYIRETGGKTKYIKGIQETTAQQIKILLTQSIADGKSYGQIASDLRKLFEEQITTKRATLIAVTETAAAYEAGNRAFAKSMQDAGTKMEKIWVTSHDGKVSAGCSANEAEGWVSMDFVYSNGGQSVTEPPRFPGCRCYEQYREVE